MKKWILIVVLALALGVAVMLASRSNTPAGGETPSDNSGTTESTGTEETGTEGNDISIESTLTYEEYQSMTGSERQTHLESFSSMDAFLAWLNSAKADYEADQATRPTISGDQPIDIGDLIGGNGENTESTGDNSAENTESTGDNSAENTESTGDNSAENTNQTNG